MLRSLTPSCGCGDTMQGLRLQDRPDMLCVLVVPRSDHSGGLVEACLLNGLPEQPIF